MGIDDAAHAEYGDGGTPIISLLACSLAGTEIELKVVSDTKLAAIYGATKSPVEQTTCNYGLNVAVQNLASSGGMIVSATDETGEVRAIERPDHAFFVGTLFQPQMTSRPEAPAPILSAFVNAAVDFAELVQERNSDPATR